MLVQWLQTGDFNDVDREFMITKLKSSEASDKYQEDFLHSRFELSERNNPRLLEDVKKKILLAGIYRNIQNFLKCNTEPAGLVNLIWDRKK